MSKRTSQYQTNGVGYGSYRYPLNQHMPLQNTFRNHQVHHIQPVNYPMNVTHLQNKNLTGPGYFQPTGINSGINIMAGKRNRSSSSSSSNSSSPSRLAQWRQRRNQKKIARQSRRQQQMQQNYNMTTINPIMVPLKTPQSVIYEEIVTYHQHQNQPLMYNQSQNLTNTFGNIVNRQF